MKKRHIFTIINLAALVFALMLWVIALAAPDLMPGFGFAWAAFVATIIWAVSFTVRIFFEEEVVLKKSWSILATVFYVTATGCIVGALALPGKLVLPILCLAAAIALLVGSLVLGGKKWDEGDNQKPGYKNYYERKEEARLAKEAALAEEQEKVEKEAPATETEEN